MPGVGGGGQMEQTNPCAQVLLSPKGKKASIWITFSGKVEKCLENGNMVKKVKT